MSKKGFHRFIRDLRNFFRGETKWFIVQYKSWLFFHFIRRNMWTVKNWCPRQRNVEFVLSRADFLDKLVIVITNIMRVFSFGARRNFGSLRGKAQPSTELDLGLDDWIEYPVVEEFSVIMAHRLSRFSRKLANSTGLSQFYSTHLHEYNSNSIVCDLRMACSPWYKHFVLWRTIYIERSSVTASIVTIIAS